MTIPTKPIDVQWTDVQWKAIYAAGHDVLVSAAAGSGKTAVLIERLIQKILAPEKERIDVDELLVVTFTNASAAEMRNRMAEALEKALSKDPSNAFLRRQLSLLNKAQISTLHSFCLSICREFAYTIDLDPGFRLASTEEASLLQDDVLMDVLEKAYRGDMDALFSKDELYALVDSFASDRSDQAIEFLLQEMYKVSRVQPKPYEWLRELPTKYDIDPDAPIDTLAVAQEIRPFIIASLQEAASRLEKGLQIVSVEPALEKNVPLFGAEYTAVKAVYEALIQGTWEQAYALMPAIEFGRIKAATKKDTEEDRAKYTVAKEHRDQAKAMITGLKETFFARHPKLYVQEMAATKPILETLVKLTIEYSEAFKKAKQERGLLDFSDLEHYALEILTAPNSDTTPPTPSEVAIGFKHRFKEVLVDEYQDVNFLQETILQLVKSGDEASGNMFMVGDVKQSIYAFRLAEPRLFLDKYKRFDVDPTHNGMKIDLNANFRSRSEVLEGTNYVFEQIMDEEVGEIEYDEQAKLKFGASYDAQQVPIELVLLEGDSKTQIVPGAEDDTEEESISAAQQEARYIIERIRGLVEKGGQVYNPKTKSMRPVNYRDIVVLMRSRSWYTTFAEEFKMAGLPLYAETDGGYFESLEVMIMINTLKVIDNPYQDIPLASVLRAPFIGLTENELAAIRLVNEKVPFYDALKQYREKGSNAISNATEQKLDKFFSLHEKWRNFSRHGALADLVWQVYLDTNYIEMVGAMANGKQRQANLRALHDRALSYEKSSFRGLFRFLRFIDRMHARGDDLGIAKSISEADDVVTLITIHKSKGLEYPVVFVAGMSKNFNTKDLGSRYIFDQEFGLAIKSVNPDLNIISTSLPHLYVKEKKLAKLKAEEMRILYVAMTRAKERLILVGSIKDWEKQKEEWQFYQDLQEKVLPKYVRSKANNYLSWVGPAVARHDDFLFANYRSDNATKTEKWTITVVPNSDYLATNELTEVSEDHTKQVVNEDLVSLLTKRFSAVYPYKQAVIKKSKTSVSELKRLESLQQMEDEQLYNTDAKRYVKANVPSFMLKGKKNERKLSATEIGTAVHAVMQHAPQQGFTTLVQVEQFIQSLVERQLLQQIEAEAVQADKVLAFFQAEIGQRFTKASQILREMPFTLSLKDKDGDAQIIQGVIDCLFEDANGQWVLLDYKTDFITPSILDDFEKVKQKMTKSYQIQLNYYQQAVQSIKRIDISEKYLYLYSIGQQLKMD
ncbi:helicase-exonuclease AddAB subunit AddA [Solibacillus sp. MA9]|uniref:ATP-dependent helicase/nuclease subunit A n=1 Tax=Solibacillus palustris TaxID=2908203 RepID=A0ABS9U8M5_9BACL|nr:helicase-exonuclease AddAB subunit AddA [Solibacillus sp. MA9]MCH7320681.1 helicase-exonuclease AddAB subunit AddA [Solibacillus sp. MA9]